MTDEHPDRRNFCVLALAAVMLLAIHGPLFLCSPLGPDPVMYDLQARLVEDGGVLYRDVLEPNLPGAVWMHLLVRRVCGWSSEALRAADLAWFGMAAVLIAALMATATSASRKSRNGTWIGAGLIGLLLVGGYSTLSEWCHCQRDVWALPFVLTAVLLRVRRLISLTHDRAGVAFVEGLLWGAAIWLKPHVLIPALATYGTFSILKWTQRRGSVEESDCRFAFMQDASALLLGGLMAGAVGLVWLFREEAWPHLWSMLTEWNPEYLAASADRWTWDRFWTIQARLAPWSLVHVAAIPVAGMQIVSVLRGLIRPACDETVDPTAAVISALYLGWLAQAHFLQHLFEYVHVPGMAIGVAVLAARYSRPLSELVWTPRLVAGLAAGCVSLTVAARAEHLKFWSRCVVDRGSPEVRAGLARLPVPDWDALERVRMFLAELQLRDGELTAYHTHTVHLYPALKVRPSTRFVFTDTHLRLFPSRIREIEQALEASPQRYVVSNLLEAGVDAEHLAEKPEGWRRGCPPDALQRFPFNHPVVFRAGPYLVHRVQGGPGPLETGFFPLAAKTAGL
jgi:hypothetical protein